MPCCTNMTLSVTYPCVRPNPYFTASMIRELHSNEASREDKYNFTENLIIFPVMFHVFLAYYTGP